MLLLSLRYTQSYYKSFLVSKCCKRVPLSKGCFPVDWHYFDFDLVVEFNVVKSIDKRTYNLSLPSSKQREHEVELKVGTIKIRQLSLFAISFLLKDNILV